MTAMPSNASDPGSSVVKLRPKEPPAQQAAPKACEPSLPPSKAPYVPTALEAAIIEARERRKAKTARAPTLKIVMKDGVANIRYKTEADYVLLMELLCLHDEEALKGYVSAVTGYISDRDGKPDNQTLNFIIQFVVAMKPRDPAEALLFTQMAVIHMGTIRFAGNSNRETRIDVKESYQRSLNKLARTYAAQMSTLKHYRSDGKQKIVVKHVTVNEGGQAIVGDVTHGGPGGGASENLEATA